MLSAILLKEYPGTNFITGMRAWAAIGVVLIHCGGAGLRSWGYIGNNIADMEKLGVYVFFVISGFSVTASYKNGNFMQYLKKEYGELPLCITFI